MKAYISGVALIYLGALVAAGNVVVGLAAGSMLFVGVSIVAEQIAADRIAIELMNREIAATLKKLKGEADRG